MLPSPAVHGQLHPEGVLDPTRQQCELEKLGSAPFCLHYLACSQFRVSKLESQSKIEIPTRPAINASLFLLPVS